MVTIREKGYLRKIANEKRANNLQVRKRRAKEKRARVARKLNRKA